MDLSSPSSRNSLEDKLFKNALYLGISVIPFLMSYDIFYTKEYHSVILEVVTAIFLLINLWILQKRPATVRHRYAFSIMLMVFVNLGWITGAGVNQLNSTIFFISISLILIINKKEIYPKILIVAALNLIALFCLQYFGLFSDYKSLFESFAGFANNFVIGVFMIAFGCYLIIFLKLNYNREREKLNQANILLKNQSAEISNQNEELTTSKEMLDETIETLETQREELIGIKGSLQLMVQERTNDLLTVNERLMSQNQQLEQYAYITSHNLRAPIGQIKGLIHLLPMNENFDAITIETLNRLKESAVSLEKVFTDLAKIIKVEKGMQQPWETINFVDEILEVVGSLKSAIIEKGITVTKPQMGDVFNVKALRPYIYSVFHNIIENAVKYSDPNKNNSFIKIRLSESSKYHIVSISDNGIGIDMEVADTKIFQMYQRFNNTHPGLGFGLFMVKSQMEALGGSVELDSVLGQGTTFNLYFPKR